MATITSVNSQLSLAIQSIFPVPVIIQGYSVDDAFESESVPQSEVLMGVDGKLSGGKIFSPYKMTIHLQADSPSTFIFDQWKNAQDAAGDVFACNGTIVLPANNMVYTLTNGFLTSITPFSGVKKTLSPLAYEITFNNIVAAQL